MTKNKKPVRVFNSLQDLKTLKLPTHIGPEDATGEPCIHIKQKMNNWKSKRRTI